MKIKFNILSMVIFIIFLQISCGGGGCGLEDDRTDEGLIDEVDPSLGGGLRLYNSRDYLVENLKFIAVGFTDLDNEDNVHFFLTLTSPVPNSQVKLTLQEVLTINGESFEFVNTKDKQEVGYSLIGENPKMSWYYQITLPRSNLYTLYFRDQQGAEISYEFNFNDDLFISSASQPLTIDQLRETIEIEINHLDQQTFDFATQCYFDETKLVIDDENLNLQGNIIHLNLSETCRTGNVGFFTNYAVATNRKLTFDFKEEITLGSSNENLISIYSIRNYYLYMENSLFANRLIFPEVELSDNETLGIRVHRSDDDAPLYCAGSLYGIDHPDSGGRNQQEVFVVDERLFLNENISSDTEVILYFVKSNDPKFVCYVGNDNQGGYLFDNFFEVLDQSDILTISDLLGNEVSFGNPEVLIDFKNTGF